MKIFTQKVVKCDVKIVIMCSGSRRLYVQGGPKK